MLGPTQEPTGGKGKLQLGQNLQVRPPLGNNGGSWNSHSRQCSMICDGSGCFGGTSAESSWGWPSPSPSAESSWGWPSPHPSPVGREREELRTGSREVRESMTSGVGLSASGAGGVA